MEDALALSIVQDEATYKACLNPCCNGRCTRTTSRGYNLTATAKVLILVVMEDALAHLKKGMKCAVTGVLILVVMEDALALGVSSVLLQ